MTGHQSSYPTAWMAIKAAFVALSIASNRLHVIWCDTYRVYTLSGKTKNATKILTNSFENGLDMNANANANANKFLIFAKALDNKIL